MKKPKRPRQGTNPYKVLQMLKEDGEITGFDIINKLKILSYNSTIFRLRQMGYNITTTNVYVAGVREYGVFELVQT